MAKSRESNETVSIRKIDNGYIITRSTMDKGGYKCSESFSAQRPTIEVPKKAEAKPRTSNPLMTAAKAIK